MTTTDTADTLSSVAQCIRIFEAGASYVRLTVRNIEEARNLKLIKEELLHRGYDKPLIADVHFNPAIANVAAGIVEKVRINPGNFTSGNIREALVPLIRICEVNHTILRIGVNHGSLSERILQEYGNNEEGMVASAFEYLDICREEHFENVVISLKSSNTLIMIRANRLFVKRLSEAGLDPAIHLGVTEAGEGEDGRIKSAIGIGTLLCECTGNTIRVSLTEEPEHEIPAAEMIIKASEIQTRLQQDRVSLTTPESVHTSSFLPVGSEIIPVVVCGSDKSTPEPARTVDDPQPDILYYKTYSKDMDLTGRGPFILPYREWSDHFSVNQNIFPLFSFDEFKQTRKISDLMNFVLLSTSEFDTENVLLINSYVNTVIILECDDSFSNQSYRSVYRLLVQSGFRKPVIIKINYNIPDKEYFIIKTAVDTGGLFVDRICNGIWLTNEFFNDRFLTDTSFNILQSSRIRMVKTEYIACPSCGRTLFDISKTLLDIKSRTSRLKHLKIAVMGCIVNGPGEMADADYGYVGSGKGKITLYRGREAVRKGIREEDAVEELISLIKSDGRWIESSN